MFSIFRVCCEAREGQAMVGSLKRPSGWHQARIRQRINAQLAMSCVVFACWSVSLLQEPPELCPLHNNNTDCQNTNKRKEVEINNIKAEISSSCESAKYLGQTITFLQQETAEIKNRIRAAWASFYRYKQELTSRPYFLPHRLRLFNMVITQTLSYASGTWTPPEEHERMIRSTQRKMLRFIVQTKRKYKKKTQPSRNDEDEEDENANHRSSDDETAEGSSSNTD